MKKEKKHPLIEKLDNEGLIKEVLDLIIDQLDEQGYTARWEKKLSNGEIFVYYDNDKGIDNRDNAPEELFNPKRTY